MEMEGWNNKSLGAVAKLVKGISYSSENYCAADEGVVFLTIKCVSKSGGFKKEGIKYYCGPIDDKEKLKVNDLLIANTDLTRDGDIVGCPVLVPDLGVNTVTMSMDLSKIVIDLDQIDGKFLYYKLMTDPVRRFMKDHASGSTVLHLQTKAVPNLDLFLPLDKAEQMQIAKILSTIDKAIEQTEAIIAKQQRIKTGLMQDLLTRGIDGHGNIRSEQTHQFKNSLLGRIPMEWEIDKLGNLATQVTSGSRGWAQYYSLEGAIFLRIGNLTREHINFCMEDIVFVMPPISAEGKRTAVQEGDILISVTADLGIIAVVPKEFKEAYVNQHIALVRLQAARKVNPRYIGYVLAGHRGQQQFDKLNESGAKAGLNLPTIGKLIVTTPQKHEQDRIVEVLDSTDGVIFKEQSRLAKLRRLKTGLMQDLLTGEVRVTEFLKQKSASTQGSLK